MSIIGVLIEDISSKDFIWISINSLEQRKMNWNLIVPTGFNDEKKQVLEQRMLNWHLAPDTPDLISGFI